MHGRLTHLYDCKCGHCNHNSEKLELALDPKFKSLLKSVEKAFKKLYKNGSYKPEDLGTQKEFREVITKTNAFLSRSLVDNDLSEPMLKSLQEDIFLFSGLKTHAQLLEASQQLLTSDKKIKSFEAFSKDVKSIKKNYNENYLEAEYDFAVGSVLMADKWENFSDSDRYHLQYRTASDNRVRDSHAALHDITLPKEDPFWDKYFPPNGWRCRCTVTQVLAYLNKLSDASKAQEAGEAATYKEGKNGKNKLEIFRFNPGKQKVIFPPKHPYNKVKGAAAAKKATVNIAQGQILKKQPGDEEEVLTIFGTSKASVSRSQRIKDAKKAHKRITHVEAYSVIRYTGTFYQDINEYLRSGKRDKPDYESYIRVTNSGLDRIKSYKGYSYRGTKLETKDFEKYVKAKDNNEPFTEPAYLSTTSDTTKIFNGNAFFEVKSKSGKSVKEISSFPDEQEILFKAETQFKVIEAVEVDGKYNIILEEL